MKTSSICFQCIKKKEKGSSLDIVLNPQEIRSWYHDLVLISSVHLNFPVSIFFPTCNFSLQFWRYNLEGKQVKT